MQANVVKHTVWSGVLAATASVFGKVAMSGSLSDIETSDWRSMALLSFRAVMLALMIVTNGLMWTQFTKALKHCTNSLHVIVVNTSTNFFLTALYGKLLFKEELSIIWWIGSTLIVIGLLIIKINENEDKEVKTKVH